MRCPAEPAEAQLYLNTFTPGLQWERVHHGGHDRSLYDGCTGITLGSWQSTSRTDMWPKCPDSVNGQFLIGGRQAGQVSSLGAIDERSM